MDHFVVVFVPGLTLVLLYGSRVVVFSAAPSFGQIPFPHSPKVGRLFRCRARGASSTAGVASIHGVWIGGFTAFLVDAPRI